MAYQDTTARRQTTALPASSKNTPLSSPEEVSPFVAGQVIVTNSGSLVKLVRPYSEQALPFWIIEGPDGELVIPVGMLSRLATHGEQIQYLHDGPGKFWLTVVDKPDLTTDIRP